MRLTSKKWTRKTEHQFFQSLRDLQQNGYSLCRSLDVLQAMYPKISAYLLVVRRILAQGRPLTEALATFVRQGILDELSLVSLHGYQLALLSVIGQRERQQLLQRKRLITVLCYPVLLLLLLSILGAYLSFCLMPQIGAKFYDQITWWGIGIVCMSSYLIPAWFKRLSKHQQLAWVQRIPVIGPIIQLSIQQGLCIQIGYLLMSGVNLYDVVTYCQGHQRYWLCQLIGPSVANAWEQGQTLERGLNQVQYLPTEAKTLFMRGNPTQQVGRDLVQLAEHLNVRQEQRIQAGLASVQPLLFLVIGLLVVGLYMMLLLPIYDQMLTMGGPE